MLMLTVLLVDADGRSASGGVTHFSYFVFLPSGLDIEAQGIFGDISGTVTRGSRAGDDEATLVQAVFDQAVTDSSGSTSSTVSTGELASGVVVVETDHLWTDQPGEIAVHLNQTVEISLGGLTGTWGVSGTETWTSCTDPTDDGSWGGSGEITITRLGETFSGWGTFPRTSDVIVGTVTRTGPTRFTVEGTTNYTEDWGECDADGC